MDAPATHARSELPRLNGCWVAVSAELDGVQLSDDVLEDLTLHVHNGWFIFGDDEGILTIEGHLHPPGLDLLAVDGPSRGRFVPAIFEQSGGMLRVCYALLGADRPKTFRAPLGSRQLLVTYRRVGAALQALG
jgi:uncharacterized protein (TIGR03067 family)